jgi:hypothetical protein
MKRRHDWRNRGVVVMIILELILEEQGGKL